jgi:protein associated with RNAse G/E
VEVKTTLSGRTDRFPCEVIARDPDRVVLLYRLPKDFTLHGIPLQQGSPSLGYFWPKKPLNLYHFHTLNHQTAAYYFNVGDVIRLDENELEWRDLAVDVLATPAGRVDVLDEDELPPDLSPATRAYIDAARDTILRGLAQLTQDAERDSRQILRRLPHHSF